MRRSFVLLFGLAAIVLALAPMALAQETIDAQMFRPSIFNGNFLAIEDAHTMDAMCYGFGLYANYANQVVQVRADGELRKSILTSVTTINGVAAVSPWSWLSLGVDVPVHIQSRSKRFKDVEINPNEEDKDPGDQGLEDNAALGDIKGELKLGILKEERAGLGLAIAGWGTFPTGDAEIFLGEGTMNFGGKMMIEKDFNLINIALNGGYLVRPERRVFGSDIGNSYLFGAGMSRDFKSGLGFALEFWGQQFITQNDNDVQPNPMEVLFTLRYKFGNALRVLGGGGMGVSEGIGSPSYRVVAGVDYFPHCEGPTQGKLIVNVVNEEGAPVKAAMKIAGPKGVLKPKGAESKTFKVITDPQGEYRATIDPGEYAMVAVAKGYLPSATKSTVLIGKTTKTTIVMKLKKAPTTFQVNVIYKKTKKLLPGAAILIKNPKTKKLTAYKPPSGQWKSKYEPGTYIVSAFAKGYERVDESFEVVKETHNVLNIPLRQKIIKIGKVQFPYNSAVIKVESYPVLDDVVKKLRLKEEEAGFEKVIIEGHTSTEGTDEYNMKLSQKRAESVKVYLIKKGFNAELLEPVGFGESRPLRDDEESDEAKEMNRRVEFIFEETAEEGEETGETETTKEPEKAGE